MYFVKNCSVFFFLKKFYISLKKSKKVSKTIIFEVI